MSFVQFKKIGITGASGFVASNLIQEFEHKYKIRKYHRSSNILIDEEVVIHLAAISDDVKNARNPEEYFNVNTEYTKKVFRSFLNSNASIFIMLSSVKAIADSIDGFLSEETRPNPMSYYGKSKLLAERFIFSNKIPEKKKIFVLRPCMIHGPRNLGNIKHLYNVIAMGYPWPLGKYTNVRSYCSIDNLLFVIDELISREDIPSGVYNVADNQPVSTNELVTLMAMLANVKPRIWNIPKSIINTVAIAGDYFNLPLNSDRLKKLSESYLVSNEKLVSVLKKPLPLSSHEGLIKTFNSFK
jgi:nucleoside-diphosphate-sugar epimerase